MWTLIFCEFTLIQDILKYFRNFEFQKTDEKRDDSNRPDHDVSTGPGKLRKTPGTYGDEEVRFPAKLLQKCIPWDNFYFIFKCSIYVRNVSRNILLNLSFNCRYYQALKVLEELEHTHLALVEKYRFTQLLAKSMAPVRKEIKDKVGFCVEFYLLFDFSGLLRIQGFPGER